VELKKAESAEAPQAKDFLVTIKASDRKLYQLNYSEAQIKNLKDKTLVGSRFSNPRVIVFYSEKNYQLENEAISYLTKNLGKKEVFQVINLTNLASFDKNKVEVDSLILKNQDGKLYRVFAVRTDPVAGKWELKLENFILADYKEDFSIFTNVPQWMKDLGVTPRSLYEYYRMHPDLALDRGQNFFDLATGKYKLPMDWWLTMKPQETSWMKNLKIKIGEVYNYYKLHPSVLWEQDSAFFDAKRGRYSLPKDWPETINSQTPQWMKDLGITTEQVSLYLRAHPNTVWNESSAFLDEKTGKYELPADWIQTLRSEKKFSGKLDANNFITFVPHLKIGQPDGGLAAAYWAVDYPSEYMGGGYRNYLYDKSQGNSGK
jgi:hypothetical protein